MATIRYDTATLAACSLLTSRLTDAQTATALTANVPAVGMSHITHFQAREIVDIRLHIKHTQPEWNWHTAAWRGNRDPNIDRAVHFLQQGGLRNNKLVLPNEALTFYGLKSTAQAIMEVTAGGHYTQGVAPRQERDGPGALVRGQYDSMGNDRGPPEAGESRRMRPLWRPQEGGSDGRQGGGYLGGYY